MLVLDSWYDIYRESLLALMAAKMTEEPGADPSTVNLLS